MPSAEIITIGTEILLGEIVDTNARTIALNLRETGVDLYRKTTIGDNPKRIAQVIREALRRSEIIITTGGLGPTVDDPTRDAVALAVGVQVEFRPELWEQIQARFRRFGRLPTENNRRQAYIPTGAYPIENPVGTAPAFIVENGEKSIISLPGVPSEMACLMLNVVIPYLKQRYQIQTVIKTRTLHTAGAGESQIDDLIGDFEKLTNPTVGLAAHSGQVDIRIVAKADSELTADSLIQSVEDPIRLKLEDWIYGVDQDTLEAAAMAALVKRNWSLAVFEAGSGGELSRRLARLQSDLFHGGEVIGKPPETSELMNITEQFRSNKQTDVGVGIAISPGTERQEICIVLITPEIRQQLNRPYGGPPEYAPRYAVHNSLDLLRKL